MPSTATGSRAGNNPKKISQYGQSNSQKAAKDGGPAKTMQNFVPKSTTNALIDDDLDACLDNLGLGGGQKADEVDDFFGGPAKKKGGQEFGQARDTLGFLKRAEDEKREKAQQKLLQ